MKNYRKLFVYGVLLLALVHIMGCSDDGGSENLKDTSLTQFQCDNYKSTGRLSHLTAPAPPLNIIGGQSASMSEWPWIAALIYQGEAPINGQHCGGSLIHPNWILTAAHCIDVGVDALLGTSSLLASPDQYERIPVVEMIAHPNYNPQTDENDIALYRLAYSSRQPTATLDRASLAQPGETTLIAGWGVTSIFSNSSAPNLLQVSLPIITNELCNQTFPEAGWVTSSMFCAGAPEGGRDSCFGDSGGPALVDGMVAGIVSWGPELCAQPGGYGVYTRVSDYMDWISSVVCSYEVE